MYNFFTCTRKKKLTFFLLFVIFYFSLKQRFQSINVQMHSLRSYCCTKIKICIKLSYLTGGKTVEKADLMTLQLCVWIETEHTLFWLFEKKNIDLFSTTKYWLLDSSWNEYQRKRRAKCQIGCVKSVTNALFHSHQGQEHLLSSK